MYSYSYDVTHTLQFNMMPYNLPTATSADSTDASSAKCQFWQTGVDDDRMVHDSSCAERDVEDASCGLQADLFADDSAASTTSSDAPVDDSNQTNAKHSGLLDLSASSESKGLL